MTKLTRDQREVDLLFKTLGLLFLVFPTVVGLGVLILMILKTQICLF